MMRHYELVERVQRYDPSVDESLLNRAYVYAMKAHGNQKRASGAPYISHPIEVAAILTELKLDTPVIAAALLHDVIEDTGTTRAEIDQMFGTEIGALVEGLTKLRRLDLVSKRAEQAENFRKLLVAISADIRVLLIKLADRLHNMRTLEHMKPASRERISQETLDIYAPLAGRMGMQAMRDELEDLAFRWLHPEAYKAITGKLAELRVRNEGLIEEIRQALHEKLAEAGISAEIYGREKKAYSIWRKMEHKQIGFEQLSDIYAFRAIAGSVSDCYRILGVVHTAWRTVPGRFKDYISTPKQNNYQSIHTTVVGPRHQRVELQIRTSEMHNVAEYGVAAHSFYKDRALPGAAGAAPNGSTAEETETSPYLWLRRLVETLLAGGSNSEEFLEHTKLELFQDQVFCFTPKGRLIALPHGATPLDFAYAIHTDVGNAAIGAYINGRHVPIDTRLRNGDEVEIQTSEAHTPPASWEGFAVTGRARAAIRRAARDAIRREYAGLGRHVLVQAFARAGREYNDELLRKGVPRLGYKQLEDVLAAVARNEVAIDDCLKAAFPDIEIKKPPLPVYRPRNRYDTGGRQKGWFNLRKAIGLKFRITGEGDSATAGNPRSIPIRRRNNDIPVTFEEGGAVPGDRIVGVLTPGEGIRIFQIHSPLLKEYEHERWMDVAWDIDPEFPERFPAYLKVVALNEPGTLAQIAQVIGEADGNIDNIRMQRRTAGFTEMHIEIEVWDLAHLNNIMAGLKLKTVVAAVERVFTRGT